MDDNGCNNILRVRGVGATPEDQQVVIEKRLNQPEELSGISQWPNCLQSIPIQNAPFQLASSELIFIEDDRLIIPVSCQRMNGCTFWTIPMTAKLRMLSCRTSHHTVWDTLRP